jgi:hypothetical protein
MEGTPSRILSEYISYRPVTSRSPGFLDIPISRRAGSSTALPAAWHELTSWVLPAVLATGLCVLCSTTLLGTVWQQALAVHEAVGGLSE